MDFEIPAQIRAKLAEIDAFVETEIRPLEAQHPQYFDHRREHAATHHRADRTTDHRTGGDARSGLTRCRLP